MEVHVKRHKIGEIHVKILGGGKIGVAHQPIRVSRFCSFHQFAQKPSHAFWPMPASNIRRNLVADETSQDRSVSATRFNALSNRAMNLSHQLRRIKKRDMFSPRNANEHA